MTRKDIYKVLEPIVEKGIFTEEDIIHTAPKMTVLVDVFLEMYGDYELTLSSLSTIPNIKESAWFTRFIDWNERAILPN